MSQFLGTVVLGGQIECVTGLHIGGAESGYEIGGTENAIIRDPVSGYPYIPGSSLKGKMRSLMEWAEGLVTDGKVHSCSRRECNLCRVFGSSPGGDEVRRVGPTRLTVRDAFPGQATKDKMDVLEAKLGLPKVEVKTEVVIDRVAGAALKGVGPRSQERVPVGSQFDLFLYFALFDVDGVPGADLDLLPFVPRALRYVEDSALGGGGSRGSGQVLFHLNEQPGIRPRRDYLEGKLDQPAGELRKLADFDVAALCAKVRERLGS